MLSDQFTTPVGLLTGSKLTVNTTFYCWPPLVAFSEPQRQPKAVSPLLQGTSSLGLPLFCNGSFHTEEAWMPPLCAGGRLFHISGIQCYLQGHPHRWQGTHKPPFCSLRQTGNVPSLIRRAEVSKTLGARDLFIHSKTCVVHLITYQAVLSALGDEQDRHPCPHGVCHLTQEADRELVNKEMYTVISVARKTMKKNGAEWGPRRRPCHGGPSDSNFPNFAKAARSIVPKGGGNWPMEFHHICLPPEIPLATFEYMASGSISGKVTVY